MINILILAMTALFLVALVSGALMGHPVAIVVGCVLLWSLWADRRDEQAYNKRMAKRGEDI